MPVPSATAVPSTERFVGATEGRDRVELSEAARLRQRLRTEVGDLGAMATEQVANLRGRLAADSYQPAPHAVAQRLLADVAADLIV